MRARIAVIVICALAVGGCLVRKSTYEKLKEEKEAQAVELLGEIDQRDQKIQTLEEALAEEQAELEKLQAEHTALEQQYGETKAALQSEVDSLEGEMAAVIKDKAQLEESAEELRAALADVSKRKAQAEARVAEFRKLLAKFKNLIDAGKLRVKIADGRMVLELPTDVLFDSGSAELSDAGENAIAEVGQVLGTFDDRRFQVEGHTDNVPIKTRKYPSNWALAADRAITVVDTLIDAGVGGSQLSAASYGSHRPVASNDSEAGRTANRRIEIVMQPDLSQLPGFDELRRVMQDS